MTSSTPDRQILIVDDDPGQRSLLESFLTSQGYRPTIVDSGEAALSELATGPYQMMISDVRMPGITGLETLRRARQLHPNLPVLLVTAYADVKDAVGAMRDGAVNYLEKPIDLDELLASVHQVVRQAAEPPSTPTETDPLPPHLIASSPARRQIYQEANLVAPSDSRVIITGESGSGRETLATHIQSRSQRNNGPLTVINCASAHEQTINQAIEHSTNGTLILRDIADLTLDLQALLLASIKPESSSQPKHVRLLTTAKPNLGELVKTGQFRDDLYFHLNVIEIFVPPLRELKEDIHPLATAFIREFTEGHARFAPEVRPCLENYQWPGNIRELRNAMERAALMAHSGLILSKHLPNKIQEASAHPGGSEASRNRKMTDVERETILETLRQNRNNRSVTARVLGISRRALTYKLQRYREEGFLNDS